MRVSVLSILIFEVMKFWIRINGLQEGPMEIDQMKDYNVTPTTYVWCAGMKDWAYARDVEDLKNIILWDKTDEEPPTFEDVSEENEDDSLNTDKQLEDTDKPIVTENKTDEIPDDEEDNEDYDSYRHEESIKSSEPRHKSKNIYQDEERPCPSNNLIWAILCTIFCCQITGIIAIVFAAQVSSKYEENGYAAAKKYSDWAGIMCIVSVILAILACSIFLPFFLLAPFI